MNEGLITKYSSTVMQDKRKLFKCHTRFFFICRYCFLRKQKPIKHFNILDVQKSIRITTGKSFGNVTWMIKKSKDAETYKIFNIFQWFLTYIKKKDFI